MADFTATTGEDHLTGGGDQDLFIFAAGTPTAGDTFDGGGGSDSLFLAGPVAGVVDFRAVGAGFTSIEGLTFGAGGFQAEFDAAQLDGGIGDLPTDLVVTGSAGRDIISVILSTVEPFDLSGWTFVDWIPSVSVDVIKVFATGGAQTITGSSQADQIFGGDGDDTIAGGDGDDGLFGQVGADTLTGGLGADTFILEFAGDLAAGETIDGTAEAGTIDTLRFEGAGTFDLSDFTIANIDAIVFRSSLVNLKIGDDLVSTADANRDGIRNDLQIGVLAPNTFATTIDASSLTGSNHIVVFGTFLNGDNTILGGAGADVLDAGTGGDTVDGNGGDDTIVAAVDNLRDVYDGGTGSDTADYSAYTTGLTVALNGATAVLVTGSGSTPPSSDDTVAGIENFIGGSGNDTITGDGNANVLTGGGSEPTC